MPILRRSLARLAFAAGLLATAGCQYSGPWVDSRREVQVTFAAEPTTAVYQAAGKPGEFRLVRFEGRASVEVDGGHPWSVEGAGGVASRPVAQPRSGDRLVLAPAKDGRVAMDHGEGRKSVLRFVTGEWSDLLAGRDVVLRFEDSSWQEWTRATEAAFLRLVRDYRNRVARRLDPEQEISEARVLDFLVDEKPLVRVGRRELLVFFEAVRLQGGFEVMTRRKDPKHGWWSYELRPEVSDALASVAEATVVVGFLSLQYLAECACRCH